MRQEINIGDALELQMWFKDGDGVYADPTTVQCRVKTPDGVTTTYNYPSAEVAKDATGKYHCNFTPSQTGLHTYWAVGTGAVAVVEAKKFVVLAGPG